MKGYVAGVGVALAVLAGIAAGSGFAQQAPVKRDFESEIQAVLQAAKTAAEFEFLGTLVRTSLLPQSGGEDTRQNVPGYVTNPASAPPRDTWYSEPATAFNNLYFVSGSVHLYLALPTQDEIILIGTVY